MSDIAKLQSVVNNYLETYSPAVVSNTLQLGGESTGKQQLLDDLILVGANNARRKAERKHDWSFADVLCTGTVPSTDAGLSLTSLSEVGGGTVSMKSIRGAVITTTSGGRTPIKVISGRRLADLEQERYERRRQGFYEEFERDPVNEYVGPYLVRRNDKLFYHPAVTDDVTVELTGYKWQDDYTAKDDTDFFLTCGFDYMMHQCITEVNMLVKAFVPRQEGNLAPPSKNADEALDALIRSDIYDIIESYPDLD